MKIIKSKPDTTFKVCYFFLALVLTSIYTFPLITNLNGMFYGFPWDSLGGIWAFWWLKFSYINEFPLTIHHYLAYPYGYDLSTLPFPYLINLEGFVLTYFTNEIIAYNILKLISFPILAVTTFSLINYLISHRMISAIVGLVYAFSPFHVIHNMAHFANIYWLPMAVLFLLKLINEGGYRNGILLGVFYGLTFIDNLQYAYFWGLLIPVVIAVSLIAPGSRRIILSKRFIMLFLVSFVVFCLIVFPMIYPMLKSISLVGDSGTNSAHVSARALSDLFVFSAKPLDYIFPSKYNPLLGRLIPDMGIGPLKGHRYTEHTLYIGYSVIFFGFYALFCATRKSGQLCGDKRQEHAVYLFLVIAVVAVVLSAPPFIPLGNYHLDLQSREIVAEYKLYLPQYFLHKIFPVIRAYARMGAIVLLAFCVLAAFGLKEILDKISTKGVKCLFVCSFILIISIEYMEFPPFRLTSIRIPEVYKWLSVQPGEFAIVEYPIGKGDDPYTTYEYFFYQRIHKKYLVNGAVDGTPADKFRKEIIDISRQETVNKLSKIGVQYIFIHKKKYVNGNEYVSMDWLTQPLREKIFPVEYNGGTIPSLPSKRLRLIKDFGETAVYEIIPGT